MRPLWQRGSTGVSETQAMLALAGRQLAKTAVCTCRVASPGPCHRSAAGPVPLGHFAADPQYHGDVEKRRRRSEDPVQRALVSMDALAKEKKRNEEK